MLKKSGQMWSAGSHTIGGKYYFKGIPTGSIVLVIEQSEVIYMLKTAKGTAIKVVLIEEKYPDCMMSYSFTGTTYENIPDDLIVELVYLPYTKLS